MVGKPLPSFTQEPFSIEIDTNTEAKIMEEIYTICGSKTLIVIAHRLSMIEGCGKVYKIKGDKIKTKVISFLKNNYFYTNTNPLYQSRYIQIGDFTYGNPIILSWDEGSYLKIGKYCSIADGVTIFLGGEHRVDWVTTYPFSILNQKFSNIKGHPKTKGDVTIGNDIWIGTNATIMSGVTIGDGAVIGAHNLVVNNIKPYEIVGGNPAKHIRFRFSEDIIEDLVKISWWNFEQEKINALTPFLLSNDIRTFIEKSKIRDV